MNERTKRLGTALATVIVVTSGIAHAHGDGSRGEKGGSVGKEQKAWGIAGEASAVARTIEIGMHDEMRFSPDTISVRKGETVRLAMRNPGKLMHELVIGTKDDLDRHAALMAKFPGMEHDEPYMVHVAPGRTGEILWTFNRAGTFPFACLVAGHYEAGMRGTIVVSADPTRDGAIVVARADTTMTDGEVRKIDRENRKITLRHGDIRNLDMSGMTMVFQVRDPAILDRLKTGDRVRFHAEQVNDTLVITSLEPAP